MAKVVKLSTVSAEIRERSSMIKSFLARSTFDQCCDALPSTLCDLNLIMKYFFIVTQVVFNMGCALCIPYSCIPFNACDIMNDRFSFNVTSHDDG